MSKQGQLLIHALRQEHFMCVSTANMKILLILRKDSLKFDDRTPNTKEKKSWNLNLLGLCK